MPFDETRPMSPDRGRTSSDGRGSDMGAATT